MKRKRISVAIILCMLFVCGSGACSKGEGGEKNAFPTLAPDWSNWADGSMPGSFGGGINLWKSAGGDSTNSVEEIGKNVMLDGEVVTKDGTLEVYLNYFFDIEKPQRKAMMNTVVLVTVNDEVCDFTLDGQKSENGLLLAEKPLGAELTEALLVEDSRLVKGDNELAVHMAVYYPNGHASAASVSRIFVSEIERESSVSYDCDVRTLDGSEVVTSDGKDDREIRHLLGMSSDFLYEQSSFDSSKRCTTVADDSDIKMSFPNQRGKKEAVARQAIVLVLKNGQPIGAWDGETIGSLVLNEADLNVTLPITLKKNAEEYAHLSFVFFDADSDIDTFVAERLFRFQ